MSFVYFVHLFLLVFFCVCFGLVQGVIDLFRLPYEQYQRDGRIVRGIQLGAQSFTSRTALAALELTTRLIYLLQVSSSKSCDRIFVFFFHFFDINLNELRL